MNLRLKKTTMIILQDCLQSDGVEKLRKYDFLANEFGLKYKCKICIFHYLLT